MSKNHTEMSRNKNTVVSIKLALEEISSQSPVFQNCYIAVYSSEATIKKLQQPVKDSNE